MKNADFCIDKMNFLGPAKMRGGWFGHLSMICISLSILLRNFSVSSHVYF